MSMKRLTTDEPKDNLEADLNLFYIKDHETWVRGGGPGPEYSDVSLFRFVRDVAKAYFPDVELPASNDDISFAMPEWIMDGIDSPEGVIALLYNAAWAYAELRHKLMQYEDTGLEPDVCAEYRKFEDEAVSKGVTFKRIVELMNAEQDGRLVVLPQKTVWELTMDAGPDCDMKCPVDAWDESLGCDLCSKAKWFAYERPCTQGLLKELGKTVFLNREEAEAALAGKGGAPSDAPEELVEAEWKNRLMRTFLGGMPEN